MAAHIQACFRRLPENYLFSEVARRVEVHREKGPGRPLIRLGIGDVRGPLPAAVTAAMVRAAEEMGRPEGFHGYGPEQGYPFLREAIARYDYHRRGIRLEPDEIFISDGAKSDCRGLGDLFSRESTVAVCDPTYPVYGEVSALAGRGAVTCLPCRAENGFLPELPRQSVDLIYLCFPNNPTGVAASRTWLQDWVDWANRTGAVLLYDGAYEAYITTPEVPHSIYELPGAESCAIELRSFSKTAGFTGTRCAYTVLPRALERDGKRLRDLWARRQAACFNGVAYVVQRGAEAVYTATGQAQVAEHIALCHRNGDCLREGLSRAGLTVYGGVDAPYLWVRTPGGMPSWTFFDLLLQRADVVVTPGAGFGAEGEGYVRLTAFGTAEDAMEAVERIRAAL